MRRTLSLTLAVALVGPAIGCKHKPLGAPSGGPPALIANELPTGAPLVTPGEHMTYRVSAKGVELAAYEIHVGDVIEYEGRRAVVVQARAKSVGLAAFASKVNDTFTSYVDVTTGRPLFWHSEEYAKVDDDGDDVTEHTEAKFTLREGNALPMFHRIGVAADTPEPQKLSLPEVWDYNAFLVALRSWEGAVGSKVSAEVLRSRYLWHIDVAIASREILVTEVGEYVTLRFDATSYKIARDGSRVAAQPTRAFSIWISDDDGRVPLQIVAESDFGQIDMKIIDYQPGNAVRLRN